MTVNVGSGLPRQLPEDLVFPSLLFAFGPDSDVFRDDGHSKGSGDRLHREPKLLAWTLESHEGAFLLEGWGTPAMSLDAEALPDFWEPDS